MNAPANNLSIFQSLYLFSFTYSSVDLFTPSPAIFNSFFLLSFSSKSQYKVLFHPRALIFHPVIYHLFQAFSIPFYSFISEKVSVMRLSDRSSMKTELYYNVPTHLESFWIIKKYYLLCSSTSLQFFDRCNMFPQSTSWESERVVWSQIL